MIYQTNYTPQEWSEKWGLDIKEGVCEKCGITFLIDVPVSIKGYRGFEMREHGCPENFKAANFTPVGDEVAEWAKFFSLKRGER